MNKHAINDYRTCMTETRPRHILAFNFQTFKSDIVQYLCYFVSIFTDYPYEIQN